MGDDAVSAPAKVAPSLRMLVGRTFGAFIVLYLVLAATVVVSLLTFRSKGDAVIERWQPAYSLSISVLDDLVNQETGLRGFALSHRETSLEPYREYSTTLVTHLTALRDRIAGQSQLEADLDALATTAGRWHTEYAVPFIARIRAGDPTVDAAIGSLAAKGAFDDIRARAAALTNDLRDVREDYKNDRTRAGYVVYAALSVATLLVLIVFLLIWRGVRRRVLEPVESLAAQTRAVAAGGGGEKIVPGGPREIEHLGEDVNAMLARIADELARVEAARAELMQRSDDLARSNADLEQFAYVASHDLSEPLRKVANFCQLLERQYGPQLDDKARQYIDFAVDGAKRMQVLINDLLSFSRVGRSTDTFAAVPLDGIVFRAMANLDQRMTESGATVDAVGLPAVPGDSSLLVALFQNLIGNSVKYRGAEPPHVRITAEPDGRYWRFTVRDNGIGIDAKYGDKIFAIFQRLHLRDQYGGTGIGLALCRKIVEFHGGRIWLVEEPGPGATFQFTLAGDGSVPPAVGEVHA